MKDNKVAQLQSIQILRGIAAVLVVIGHSLGRVREISEALQFNKQLAISLPTGFGVDLFFVISGFIIFVSTEKIRTRSDARKYFIQRRLIRILPIYWICTTLFILILGAKKLSGLHDDYFDLSYIVSSYFFIPYRTLEDLRPAAFPIYDLGWTLNYEIYFYVLFSLCLFKSKYLSVLFLFLAMTVMVIAGFLINTGNVPFIFWSQPIVFEFLFGMAIGILYSNGIRLSGHLSILLLILAILFVLVHPLGSPLMVNGTHLNGLSRVGLWGIAAAGIVLAAALGPPVRASLCSSKMVYLGDASYSIYLFHPFGLMVAAVLFKKLIVPGEDSLILILITSILLSITLAITFYQFVESPITSFLNARLASTKNSLTP